MRAITLHEKYTEEIIGTVLLKGNTNFDEITDAWDKYQVENNSNLESEPDIDEFAEINKNLCEVLELDFYQPKFS